MVGILFGYTLLSFIFAFENLKYNPSVVTQAKVRRSAAFNSRTQRNQPIAHRYLKYKSEFVQLIQRLPAPPYPFVWQIWSFRENPPCNTLILAPEGMRRLQYNLLVNLSITVLQLVRTCTDSLRSNARFQVTGLEYGKSRIGPIIAG